MKKKRGLGIPPNEVRPDDERLFPTPTIMNNLPINIFLPSFIPRSGKQYGQTSITVRYPVIRIPGKINKNLFPTNNMIFTTNLIIQDVFVILSK
jgi:hypothetical protein